MSEIGCDKGQVSSSQNALFDLENSPLNIFKFPKSIQLINLLLFNFKGFKKLS